MALLTYKYDFVPRKSVMKKSNSEDLNLAARFERKYNRRISCKRVTKDTVESFVPDNENITHPNKPGAWNLGIGGFLEKI